MNVDNLLPEGSYEPVFVARQPIFDRKERIWGYELLFRHSGTAATAQVLDQDQATAKVIADGFVLASAGLPPEKRLLINFPKNLLLNDSFYALPPQTCVVEILETVPPEPEILESLRAAQKNGYTLALDDFVGQSGFEPFLKLADIVKVEVLNQPREHIKNITANLQKGRAKLLAEKVENKEEFEFLRDLGYHLFQGYYFSKPEIVPGRKISSSNLSKLQLLQELEKKDYEVKDLAKIISTDVSLSYRLLNYLNSPAFGLRRSIESIQQAITILGTRSTKQWLMVIILSDLNPAPRAAELGLQSIQRARFLQLAAKEGMKVPFSDERMFLLGLLSQLDALLGHYMNEIIENMPLDGETKGALLGKKNEAFFCLELVRSFEHANWRRSESLLDSLGMSRDKAALLLAKAGAWAQSILSAPSSPQSKE